MTRTCDVCPRPAAWLHKETGAAYCERHEPIPAGRWVLERRDAGERPTVAKNATVGTMQNLHSALEKE